MNITPELLPPSTHYNNLRHILSPQEWDTLKRYAYSKTDNKCAWCGGAHGYDRLTTKWPVEAHERFKFTDDGRQVLFDIVALCLPCHLTQHVGFAARTHRLQHVENHIANINQITLEQSQLLVDQALELCKQREESEWILDISLAHQLLQEPEVQLYARHFYLNKRGSGKYHL